jgi:hypothetical protein
MNFDILYPAAFGLLFGGIVSLVFGIYSKPSATKYTFDIFGTNSSTLIKHITIFFAAVVIAIYTGFSVLIRDSSYPTEHPLRFTLETLLAASFPASILLFMTYLRNKPFSPNTALDFSALTLKCGIVHILLQFSGVYGSVFGV